MTASPIREAVPADEGEWHRLWQAYCDFYSVSISAEVTATLWSRIVDPSFPIFARVAEFSKPDDGPGSLCGFADYVLHSYTWGTEQICFSKTCMSTRLPAEKASAAR